MGVKWFQDERGIGFIEYKENGDIIIYYSTTPKEVGEAVQLEISKSDIDYKATSIKITKEVN